jgi:hypothetical protein
MSDFEVFPLCLKEFKQQSFLWLSAYI